MLADRSNTCVQTFEREQEEACGKRVWAGSVAGATLAPAPTLALLQAAPDPALRMLLVVFMGPGALRRRHRGPLALLLAPSNVAGVAEHAHGRAIVHAPRIVCRRLAICISTQQAGSTASVHQRAQQAGRALACRLRRRASGREAHEHGAQRLPSAATPAAPVAGN